MSRWKYLSALTLTLAGLPLLTSGVATAASGCGVLTSALVTSAGYTHALSPVVTPYNYTMTSANETNALGTTYDFGVHATVVSCVAPRDIKKLAKAAKVKNSAAAYLAWMVKDSNGTMIPTTIGSTKDWVDYGNGKEDGLGSFVSDTSIRLDAFRAGRYIILIQTSPALTAAVPPLQRLVAAITAAL
jgi:hypothetical protein